MATSDGRDLTNNVIRKPATIASGGTVSNMLFIGGQMIVGVDCGSALTSTALTFLNSIDGGNTYRAVENANDGTPYTVVIESGKYVHISPPLVGLDKVRLSVGSAEGAARTINVIMVP